MPPERAGKTSVSPEADGGLQQELDALQAAYPELDALAGLVWLAVRHQAETGPRPATNTALLARRLDIEHALIRRAAADLQAMGWISVVPAGGASPALRLTPLSA